MPLSARDVCPILLFEFKMLIAEVLTCLLSDLLSSSVETRDCHVCSLSLRLLETGCGDITLGPFSLPIFSFSTLFVPLMTREDESVIVIEKFSHSFIKKNRFFKK